MHWFISLKQFNLRRQVCLLTLCNAVRRYTRSRGRYLARQEVVNLSNRFSFTNKGRLKSATRIAVEGRRSQLAYADLAKSTAKRQVTMAIDNKRRQAGYGRVDGNHLKETMIAMIDRIGAPEAYRNEIMAMDPDTLAKMYTASSLAFDVFYNYEGINLQDGYYSVDDSKISDLDWFIGEYKRFASGQ